MTNLKRNGLRILILAVIVFSLFFTRHLAFAYDIDPLTDKEHNVVFLCDGKNTATDGKVEMIKAELEKLTSTRYIVNFVDVEYGDFQVDTIANKLVELFSSEDVDLVICLGSITGSVIGHLGEISKPVILADSYDINTSGFPYHDNTSGKKNLSYLGNQNRIKTEVNTFRRIYPFTAIQVLVDKEYIAMAKGQIKKDNVPGVDLILMEYKDILKETLDELDNRGIDAVYFGSSELFYDDYGEVLVEEMTKRGIATFTSLGEYWVDKGVLAGLVPRSYTKFARRVALNADRMFRGEKLEDMPVLFDAEDRIIINARTARQIAVSIPFDIIFQAKILYADEDWGDKLNIKEAVGMALNNNLIFRIKDEEVKQAGKDHLIKWSNYLPQVTYNLQYDAYDSESARHTPGVPKQYLNNRFMVNQIIFSDPAITDIINSGKQIEVEKLSRLSQSYDITDETSRAYLEYLITKAVRKVAQENLGATKEHLRMAEVRYKAGQGGKEEALRWRAEEADQKAQVILAESDVYIARIVLNQLMNHPQETPFVEQDVGLEITGYYIGGSALRKFIKNEEMLKLFISFMVERGIMDSPERDALGITIAQQTNTKNTVLRRFVLPEARFSGHLDKEADKEYYGDLPYQNDHPDWYVGLTLSYSIFEGGKRFFEYQKESSEVDRLEFKKELLDQTIELDIRKTAYRLYFSLPNIDLSKVAMENASGNYTIVQNKYSKGLATITDLIDAQRDKFTRESQAVVAVYNFLQDLTTFDRAVSSFAFFAPDVYQKQWFEDMEIYFADRGMDINSV